MKAKEIEKLLRRYVPTGTLLGNNRTKLKAELQELHQQGIKNLNLDSVRNSQILMPIWVYFILCILSGFGISYISIWMF